MHYYQFNIGDYYSHTVQLDPIEDIAYRRMIDWCYLHEKPLPIDPLDVAREVRMREHLDAISYILGKYFSLSEKGYFQKRIELEIRSYRKLSGKRKDAANKRWANKHKGLKGDASALQLQSTSNANHKPLTINQEPVNSNQKKPSAPAKAAAISLPDFIVSKKGAGEAVIPDGDPVMAYAESVGIPPEYLRICWREFVQSYSDGAKKYKDWRSVFRKAVRGNWFKLWWIDDSGGYQLTTTGKQALIAHRESRNG